MDRKKHAQTHTHTHKESTNKSLMFICRTFKQKMTVKIQMKIKMCGCGGEVGARGCTKRNSNTNGRQ